MLARGQLPPNHLFVVGQGSNRPLVANTTQPGKERNQRVELVVYPEQAPDRM
jgi:flagellar motor protein MotB